MWIRKLAKFIIKGVVRDSFWCLYGPRLWRQSPPKELNSFLFVCKGNICRSTFAHYLTLKKLSGTNKMSVFSSGTQVRNSTSSPPQAISVAMEFSLDLKEHRSQQITHEQCKKANIILTMEGWQWRELRRRYPDCKKQIFLLSQFEQNERSIVKGYHKFNIYDPYGKKDKYFRQCFQRIESCVDGVLSLKSGKAK